MFSPEAYVSPEQGKQDKIEYSAKFLSVLGTHRDDISWVLSRLGAPPPVYQGNRGSQKDRRTKKREDHGGGYGWIFNRVDEEYWAERLTVDIRKSPLLIDRGEGKRPRPIQPPLFSGACKWRVTERENGEALHLTGILNLSVNPTRFIRHHPVAVDLPEGMQAQNLSEPPLGEYAYDNQDNWFPQSQEVYAQLAPELWLRHLARYFVGIEDAFETEFNRVCSSKWLNRPRIRRAYNIKKVESYFEWSSPDPLKVVADLTPYARSFSSRQVGERIYNTEAEIDSNGGVRVLRIETAPGEILKIYAKTNRRIRMEVVHTLAGRTNRFQFPRERDGSGETRRLSVHTFGSLEGFLALLQRLQTRAANVINGFLRHVADQAEIVPSHISAYNALLNVLHAIPDDFPMALELTSELINEQGITPGGDQARRTAIDALQRNGIVELNRRRTRYVPTADYRYAFHMLREQASFPILIERIRPRSRHKMHPPDHHALLE